jgi:hypothetical protein
LRTITIPISEQAIHRLIPDNRLLWAGLPSDPPHLPYFAVNGKGAKGKLSLNSAERQRNGTEIGWKMLV